MDNDKRLKIMITTLGGLGDALMLSMPAKRIKELYPECHLTVASCPDANTSLLFYNPDIDSVVTRQTFNDVPVLSLKYDVIIDFRYGVKTFYCSDKRPVFDVPISTVEKRQRDTELDLYTNDLAYYRMKLWQTNLQKMHDTNYFGKKDNWYAITSYLSGINYTPKDLYVHREECIPEYLKGKYIAVSSRCYVDGFSKIWNAKKWNEVFKQFPNTRFFILGTVTNTDLKGANLIRSEGKTGVFQAADIIANSKFLISEEGGLVHVAKAVGKKSIVLFGPTQKWFFGYDDNINIREDSGVGCEFCHNQTPFWGRRCYKNKKSPFCLSLDNLSPSKVGSAINSLLEEGFVEPKKNRGKKKKDSKVLLGHLVEGNTIDENEENAMMETYDDDNYNSQPCQKDRMDKLVNACQEMKSGSKVLDVGSADGYLSNRLNELGFEVTPLDVSETRVRRMKEIYGLNGVVGNILKIPFSDNSFDIVIGAEILEHLDIMADGLKELERVCKPEGLLLVTIPIGKIHDKFNLHKWSIRKEDVARDGVPDMMILKMRRIHRD